MWGFKKRITFKNTIPGVAETMPMIEAKRIKHDWVKKASEEFREIRKDPEYGTNKMIHTVRCPGIFGLMRRGWVMRTWQDIVIECHGDQQHFSWNTPIGQKELSSDDYVGSHPSFQLADFTSNWPVNSLKTVIKINSGWVCNVPRGYYLMEMPVSYYDDDRFTTLPGFFNAKQGPAQMNPQLVWNRLEGKHLIRAGTPISQYILVPEDEWFMECTASHSADEEQIFNIINNRRYVKDYRDVKEYYSHSSSKIS